MTKKKARTILLVDDEALFRKSLVEGLERQEPSWRVVAAENGLVARSVLERESIDLVVTDLAMPQSDGFELLAFMVKHRPWVPVLVLTAFGTDETRTRLGTLGFAGFLEKPVDFDALVGRVSAIFESQASGVLRGISLPTFLQILELDMQSCRVRVSVGGKSGTLYIVDGALLHAEAGPLQGEAAAADIVCWDGVELEASALVAPPPRTVGKALRELMLESFRQRDERLAGRSPKAPPSGDGALRAAPPNFRASKPDRTRRGKSSPAPTASPTSNPDDGDLGSQRSGPQLLAQSASLLEHELVVQSTLGSPLRGDLMKEEVMAALESYLDEFKSVKGYIASGIMDFTGETLASQSTDAGVNLEAVGAVFNDIFRGAHEASKKIGLDACHTMALTTPKGVIVMECSGPSKVPHLHVIAILQEGGNQALAKMTIAKILPLVVKELS